MIKHVLKPWLWNQLHIGRAAILGEWQISLLCRVSVQRYLTPCHLGWQVGYLFLARINAEMSATQYLIVWRWSATSPSTPPPPSPPIPSHPILPAFLCLVPSDGLCFLCGTAVTQRETEHLPLCLITVPWQLANVNLPDTRSGVGLVVAAVGMGWGGVATPRQRQFSTACEWGREQSAGLRAS